MDTHGLDQFRVTTAPLQVFGRGWRAVESDSIPRPLFFFFQFLKRRYQASMWMWDLRTPTICRTLRLPLNLGAAGAVLRSLRWEVSGHLLKLERSKDPRTPWWAEWMIEMCTKHCQLDFIVTWCYLLFQRCLSDKFTTEDGPKWHRICLCCGDT